VTPCTPKFMVPDKPQRLLNPTPMEAPGPPLTIVSVEGVTVIEKSGLQVVVVTDTPYEGSWKRENTNIAARLERRAVLITDLPMRTRTIDLLLLQ
jgi:hypothetical protein